MIIHNAEIVKKMVADTVKDNETDMKGYFSTFVVFCDDAFVWHMVIVSDGCHVPLTPHYRMQHLQAALTGDTERQNAAREGNQYCFAHSTPL